MTRGADPSQSLDFSCACGGLKGHLTPKGLKQGTHVTCFCPDCRANELYHHQPDPAPNPVDLFQMAAPEIVITQGAEHLALMRLSPKGLMRWYASCCGTPMFNTMATPALGFAAIRGDRVSDPARLGPVRGRGFVPQPGGGKAKHDGMRAVLGGILSRLIRTRLSGSWKRTVFFDAEGKPAAEAKLLSKEERAALYPSG